MREKLDKGRIDTFLFTRNTTIYTLNKANLLDKYREAGCVSEANIFMAFSPAQAKQNKVSETMVALFDRRLLELQQAGYIQQLMQRYHLEDNSQ